MLAYLAGLCRPRLIFQTNYVVFFLSLHLGKRRCKWNWLNVITMPICVSQKKFKKSLFALISDTYIICFAYLCRFCQDYSNKSLKGHPNCNKFGKLFCNSSEFIWHAIKKSLFFSLSKKNKVLKQKSFVFFKKLKIFKMQIIYYLYWTLLFFTIQICQIFTNQESRKKKKSVNFFFFFYWNIIKRELFRTF